MADRLEIYKGALRHLGNAAGLSSLTETSPARNALDDAWQSSVDFLLEKGLWNFAIRTVELSNDEDTEPLFGYAYAFSKPDDWVRLVSICDEPTFAEGYQDYADEGDYWFANIDTLYVRYVSNDETYGLNVGAWRQSFAKCLEAYLAFSSSLPISADRGNRNDLFNLYGKLLKEAKALDAVDERVQQKPAGRLVRARMSSGYRDRY